MSEQKKYSKELDKELNKNFREKVQDGVANEVSVILRSRIREKDMWSSRGMEKPEELVVDSVVDHMLPMLLALTKSELFQLNLPVLIQNVKRRSSMASEYREQSYTVAGILSADKRQLTMMNQLQQSMLNKNRLTAIQQHNCVLPAPLSLPVCQTDDSCGEEEEDEVLVKEMEGLEKDILEYLKELSKEEEEVNENGIKFKRNLDNLKSRNRVLSYNNNRLNDLDLLDNIMQVTKMETSLSCVEEKERLSVVGGVKVLLEGKLLTAHMSHKSLKMMQHVAVHADSKREKIRRIREIRRRMRRKAEEKRAFLGELSSDETDY